MADFFQVPFNVPLRAEPRNASGFTAPKIEVDPSDELEIVGAEIPDPVLTAKKWVKVKCAKGEGFLDRKLLTPFAALPPRPDEDLPIELRRAIEVELLAKLCFENALFFGSNSAFLLALAFSATGSDWTPTTAKASDNADRFGIFGLTRKRWDEALAKPNAPTGIEAGNIQSSRSQCEIAAFITGADWAALSEAIPEGVKAVDLYLAFLVGANTAKKILLAPDEKALSAVLSADEMEPALGALKSAVPMFEPATPKKAAIDLLVEKLDVALEFVRAFAETLVAVDLPNTQDVIVKTEDDIASEEESGGYRRHDRTRCGHWPGDCRSAGSPTRRQFPADFGSASYCYVEAFALPDRRARHHCVRTPRLPAVGSFRHRFRKVAQGDLAEHRLPEDALHIRPMAPWQRLRAIPRLDRTAGAFG